MYLKAPRKKEYYS